MGSLGALMHESSFVTFNANAQGQHNSKGWSVWMWSVKYRKKSEGCLKGP